MRGNSSAELRQRAPDPNAPAGYCCGSHAPAWKGKRYVLACKLCDQSPTYWRRSVDPAGGASTHPNCTSERTDR